MLDITTIVDTIKKTNKIVKPKEKIISVSKCLTLLHKEFDQEATAINTHKKNFDNADSIYYQKSVEDIIKMWTDKADTSKHYGSCLDDYIGMYLNKEDKKLALWKLDNNFEYDNRLKGLCTGFEQFYKLLSENTDYTYVTREMTMYIKSNISNKFITGRFDCLFYSPSLNKFLIVDWKNTEKIQSTNDFGGKMFGPCYNLDDCKHNEYTFQVQFYKKALAETYHLTTIDNIDCYICQMIWEPNETGKYFKIYKQNFDFNSEFLDKVIDYSCKKNDILEN